MNSLGEEIHWLLWCSLIHLLSQHDPVPNAPKVISMMFFFFTDTEPCMEFSETLRRIVRSFDRAGQSRITVAYVKTSLHKKRFVRTDFHFCCIIVISTLHWCIVFSRVLWYFKLYLLHLICSTPVKNDIASNCCT